MTSILNIYLSETINTFAAYLSTKFNIHNLQSCDQVKAKPINIITKKTVNQFICQSMVTPAAFKAASILANCVATCLISFVQQQISRNMSIEHPQ